MVGVDKYLGRWGHVILQFSLPFMHLSIVNIGQCAQENDGEWDQIRLVWNTRRRTKVPFYHSGLTLKYPRYKPTRWGFRYVAA